MEISQSLATALTKELTKDAKEHNLSGKQLVNFFYQNYVRTESNRKMLEEPGDKVGYLQLSDRNTADQKTNAQLTKWLVEQRGELIHKDTLEKYGIKEVKKHTMIGPDDVKKFKVTHETRSSSQSQSR